MHENEISQIAVDAAVKVHSELGPGLLEFVYEVVLSYELAKRGLHIERQVSVPISYDGVKFEEGFRADIIIEGKVILEIKAIEKILPVHRKQLLTYLKLTGLKLGLILNFNAALMKDGIFRSANGLE